MSWAKLDDAILDNRKILKLDVTSFGFHVAAITWCARNLTDGFIPHGKVATLVRTRGVDPYEIATELIAAKLWRETAEGYEIHDYLAYNPSRAKVLAEREREAERKRARRSPDGVRADSARSLPHPDPDPDPVPEEIRDPPLTTFAPPGGSTAEESKSGVHVVAKGARGTRLQDDWRPSAATLAWASEKQWDALAALPEFVDHWTAVPGARGVKLDWDKTFKNRLRQIGERVRPNVRSIVQPVPASGRMWKAGMP